MWKPYLKVIAKKAGQALHILDRFHIMAKMNKAIDEVRATEMKSLRDKGLAPVLKDSRWCLLKRPKNLTERQDVRPLILNWFRATDLISTGAVEGLNNRLKVITRRAFGFRTFRATEIALYHALGALPLPLLTHRFC